MEHCLRAGADLKPIASIGLQRRGSRVKHTHGRESRPGVTPTIKADRASRYWRRAINNERPEPPVHGNLNLNDSAGSIQDTSLQLVRMVQLKTLVLLVEQRG